MPISVVGTGATKFDTYTQSLSGDSYSEMSVSFSAGDLPAGGDWIVWVKSSDYRADFGSGGATTSPTGVTSIDVSQRVQTGASGNSFRLVQVLAGRRSDLTFPATFFHSRDDTPQGTGLMAVTPIAVQLAGTDPNVALRANSIATPYGLGNITVTEDALLVAGYMAEDAAFAADSVGFLFGQNSSSGVSSVSIAGTAQAPGQSTATAMIPDLAVGAPWNRVRPNDRILVLISASGTDAAKTFTVASSAGACTRIVQHTITSKRIELWSCPRYTGTADNWAAWSGVPTVTASGGTGSSFTAMAIAARGALTGPGFGQNSWASTWASAATPTQPTGTMPTLSATSMTIGLVSWGNTSGWSPGPELNVANGWTGPTGTYSPIDRVKFTYQFGGAGTALRPGFTNAGVFGNWSWIGIRATRTENYFEPAPMVLGTANGFTLRDSSVIDATPLDWPFSSRLWNQHAAATRVVTAGTFATPVWAEGIPPNDLVNGRNAYLVCALYEAAAAAEGGIYRDGRIHLS